MRYAIPLCLALAAAASGAELREAPFPGKRTGYVLDSQLLRVGVIPAIGGRVVELTPKATGHNYLRTAPHYFGLGPDDPWPGAEYGGICDVATDGWPGPFWGLRYRRVDLPESRGALLLRLAAEAEGIGIIRDLLIPDNSTLLSIKVVQRNLTDKPMKMVVRIHNELRVGTAADASDVIFWPDGEELRSRRYIPGSESPRFCFDTVTGEWSAIADTAEREVLVHRFVRPGPPHRVFFWSGHNDPPPGVAENSGDHGFYNNERFCPRQEVAPGGSIEAVEEFWAIQGLGRVDFCCSEGAGSLELERARFGRDDPIAVTCAFGGPRAGKPLQAVVAIADAQGKAVAERTAQLPAFAAGKASRAEVSLAAKGLADGRYSIVATFRRGEAVLGTARGSFEVAAKLVADARQAVQALQQRVAKLRDTWKQDSVDRVRVSVLQARVDALKPALERGDFENAIAQAVGVAAAIDRATADRARALAPRKPPADDASAILQRYREGK